MATSSFTAPGNRSTRSGAGADTWARLVRQIAELEEILQEAAASPDQDAFGEREALTRLLFSRRQTLRELDVGAVLSVRAEQRSDAEWRYRRVADV